MRHTFARSSIASSSRSSSPTGSASRACSCRPGRTSPPPQHGIVLAVGPGLDWWEQAGIRMPVKPGDHVVFPASAGAWVEVDEERLLVCRVGELLGVLETEAESAAA